MHQCTNALHNTQNLRQHNVGEFLLMNCVIHNIVITTTIQYFNSSWSVVEYCTNLAPSATSYMGPQVTTVKSECQVIRTVKFWWCNVDKLKNFVCKLMKYTYTHRQHKCINFFGINDQNCPCLLPHKLQILVAVNYLSHNIDNALVYWMCWRHYMVLNTFKFLPISH